MFTYYINMCVVNIYLQITSIYICHKIELKIVDSLELRLDFCICDFFSLNLDIHILFAIAYCVEATNAK